MRNHPVEDKAILARSFTTLLLALVMLAWTITGPAHAQQLPSLDQVEIQQEERFAAIQAYAEQLELPGMTIDKILQIREEVRSHRLEARTLLSVLEDVRAVERNALEILGPAPVGDAAAEANSVIQARAELQAKLDRINRTISQAEFTAALATQVLERIASMRQSMFLQDVFSQGTAVYTPTVWQTALESGTLAIRRGLTSIEFWWDRRALIGATGSTFLIGFALVVAIGVGIAWTRRFLTDVLEPRIPEDADPTDILIPAKALIWGSFTGAALLLTGAALWQVDVGEQAMNAIGVPIALATLILVFAWNATRTIVPAGSGEDGALLANDVEAARQTRFAVRGILVTYFVITTVLALSRASISSVDLISVFAFLGAASISIFLFMLFRPAQFAVLIGRDEEEGGAVVLWRLRLPLQFATLVMFITSLFGLSVLSGYLLAILIKVGTLIWAYGLVRQLFAEYVARSNLIRRAEAIMSSGPDDKPSDEENEAFWWRLSFDVLALSLVIPLALLVVGVEVVDIIDFVRRLLLGFSIGGITISLTEILSAVGIFVSVLFATRMIQRALDKRILPRTKLDIGVRNSLVTLTGYLGTIIAVGLAITVVGFDLSSLTIIAGALSVGIGFGLQSIVNNFVSGLILLFERPIKVGDWIVTASGEGSVRKISVRSTEIETFDRCTIIVPNSELISAAVQNWTHKDMSGRVIVAVGVAYHSDPVQVREILLDCARKSKYALRYPEPYVYFREFGASSLDFEVRFFIRDISYVVWAKNDLRFEIFEALKENGIEIPFPQRDLHIKEVALAETLLAPAKDADPAG